jgi:hypothetical protein
MGGRQFKVPEDKEILTLNELILKWRCGTDGGTIYKAMSDGMPYKMLDKEYQFNLKECSKWWAHGWFDSLNKQKQNEILGQFRRTKK